MNAVKEFIKWYPPLGFLIAVTIVSLIFLWIFFIVMS